MSTADLDSNAQPRTGSLVMVDLDDVEVGSRFRKNLGDLSGLAASMDSDGLTNPLTVLPDMRLIAGHRRLEAARLAGWTEIAVIVRSDLDSVATALRVERDENTCRKDMVVSETVALGRALEAIERPKAAERQAESGTNNLPTTSSARPRGTKREETRNVVGKALGVSGATYNRMKYVADRAEDDDTAPQVREVARDCLREMDAGNLGAETAQKTVRRAERKETTNGQVRTKTYRGRSVADGTRRLIDSLIGITSAMEGVNPHEAAPTAEEAASWERDLKAAVSELNRFRKRLRQGV